MVEALSGGRWQGSSTADTTIVASTSDITDLTWTTVGSSTSDTFYILKDTSNDLMDIKAAGNCGTEASPSIGYATLSDTLGTAYWRMRFKLVFNTVTAESTGGKSFFTNFFFVDDGSSWADDESGFGFRFIADAGSTQTQFYSMTSGTASGTTMSWTPSSGSTIYVEISWEGGTATANFYSDSGYSNRVSSTTANATRSGTFSGLKYPQIVLRQDNGGNGVMEIDMSNLEIINRQDEKDDLTNVPANTRYEETDTRKIFRRTAGATALSGFNPEDFSSDNWTEGSCTSISGGKLIASNGHHLSNNIQNGFFTGYKAIGQTLSTNWVLRFKWKTTDMNSNSGNYDGDRVLVGVCEDSYYDNVGDGSVSAKNVIGIALYGSDSSPRFYGYANSGGSGVGWTATPNVQLTTTPATNQIRYFEIIKDGTTVYFNDFGTDSTYTTRVAQNSLTGNSFSNLDTFIVSGFSGNGATQPDVAGELDDVYIYDDTVSADPEWKERNTA